MSLFFRMFSWYGSFFANRKELKTLEVKLLTSPASFKDMENFAALAALTCHANAENEYVPHEVLGRIISKGHESILEHITLTYSVKGLSRACLQELARHRHISLSVESTRHTLCKQLTNENPKLLQAIEEILSVKVKAKDSPFYWHEEYFAWLQRVLKDNPDMTNDKLKYFLPEFWPTNLILTSNIRELRHILKLRTSPAALNEFRVLAYSLFEAVPESFRYLLEDCVYREAEHD